MINSINLEPERFARVLPLAREHGAKLIALAQGEGVPAATAGEKVDIAARLVEQLVAGGMALEDIYVDPLVFPVGTDSNSALATITAMREIMARFPGVHTICGLTNVSHGLPLRKLVNRTFLAGAIANGMDAAIIDPTDALLMATLLGAEAVFGRDEYCINFIEAFQAGKLA
jgi:5-methyltetrahydrofolate--homocysteine methyltransferase